MTGFGRGTAGTDDWQATVEISSVNRKQAEVVVQTPHELAELEVRIRKATLAVVSRGRAQVSVKIEPAATTAPEIQVDRSLAQALHRAFAAINEATGQNLEPQTADYMRQPGIISVGDSSIDPTDAWSAIEPALAEALESLATMRASEGAHLKADFLMRLQILEAHAESISKQAPARPAKYRELLMKRLKEAELDLSDEDERVAREIALFADRCDISEEVTRLQSHFTKFREYLDSTEPAGRPLDFLCQELFREFNTIGSKANDAGIAQVVVEAKTELEKIREQVQNAE